MQAKLQAKYRCMICIGMRAPYSMSRQAHRQRLLNWEHGVSVRVIPKDGLELVLMQIVQLRRILALSPSLALPLALGLGLKLGLLSRNWFPLVRRPPSSRSSFVWSCF